jgi:hypothetical protein
MDLCVGFRKQQYVEADAVCFFSPFRSSKKVHMHVEPN